MPVQYVTGDLFALDVPAIGHGVNCHGVMGSGIAPQFKTRWPNMYIAYRQHCRAKELRPGGLMPYKTPDGPLILNMATQDAPGPNARIEWIEQALRMAVWYCENEDIPEFAIPRIGAGIGGLQWEDVKAAIERVAEPTHVTITVVTLPNQA